jgi:ABC-type nitrate/sulfonate/bicarbonate transport system permease component
VISSAITKLYSWEPEGGTLIDHIIASLKISLGGFVLAACVGIPLGLLMGWSKKVDAIVTPIFEVVRQIPPIAWIPLAILWFGIGDFAKSFIIWLASFVPCVINSYTGVKLVDPMFIDLAKTFGAKDRQIFFHVVLPASLPAILTGLRHGLSLSWMCLLASEMVGAKEGLGYLILLGMDMANIAMIIGGMLVIGIVGGLTSTILIYLLERILCPWKRR